VLIGIGILLAIAAIIEGSSVRSTIGSFSTAVLHEDCSIRFKNGKWVLLGNRVRQSVLLSRQQGIATPSPTDSLGHASLTHPSRWTDRGSPWFTGGSARATADGWPVRRDT